MINKRRPLIELETKLKDIPSEWLRWFEPKIVRKGTCWHWQGAVDASGEPVITIPNPTTGKRNTRTVKRIVADLFWEMRRHYDVIHQCGNLTCINPAHFYISKLHWQHEDRATIVKKGARSVKDYINRLPK